MQKLDLTGKCAIVTGAGRGLGKNIAVTLADAGANVWVADIQEESVSQTAKELAAMGVKSGYTVTDVSKLADVEKMVADAEEGLGDIDILVNMAGIYCTDDIDSVSEETLHRVFGINLFSMVYSMKCVMRVMRRRGHGGSIVNASSVAGKTGNPYHPFYHLTKAGVLNLTVSAAKGGGPDGIRVNAICPGNIRTDMWERIIDDYQKKQPDKTRDELFFMYGPGDTAMGQAQEPEDISNAVLFLCSEQARFITGQSLNVCGGDVMTY